MTTFDNSISGNMELLKECLLNKMPVNQGDAAGESLFFVFPSWITLIQIAMACTIALILYVATMFNIQTLLHFNQPGFQATQLSTGQRAPVTWTSLKLSWLSPRCSIPSSSDLFEKLQKLKRNFIAKERKISVIWLISIFLLQVQLNTSNKLGETPIKTAAMSGKVKLDEKMQSLEISFVIMSYTIPTEFVCRHSIPYYLINLLDVSAIAKYFGSAARFLGLNPYPHSLVYPHDPTMSCNWR